MSSKSFSGGSLVDGLTSVASSPFETETPKTRGFNASSLDCIFWWCQNDEHMASVVFKI